MYVDHIWFHECLKAQLLVELNVYLHRMMGERNDEILLHGDSFSAKMINEFRTTNKRAPGLQLSSTKYLGNYTTTAPFFVLCIYIISCIFADNLFDLGFQIVFVNGRTIINPHTLKSLSILLIKVAWEYFPSGAYATVYLLTNSLRRRLDQP